MKIIKWVSIVVFGVVGLPFGCLVLFMCLVWWSSEGTGIDGGSGSWLLRALFHDGPRYFELTADLEVEGEAVEITRVIECQPYFSHQFAVGYFRKRWYRTNEAMTQRLPDGSGVIVVVPDICNKVARQQPPDAPTWRAFPALPDDFVPLILWTPDADNPEVLESHHSFESVERPDARVRFKGIALRNDPHLETIVLAGELGTWNSAFYGGYGIGNRPQESPNYVGYYLVAIGEAEWRQVPELRSALEGRAESGFLEPELASVVSRHFRTSTDFDQAAIKGNMEVRQRGRYLDSLDKPARFKFAVLDRMRGFQRGDNGLVPMADRRGVMAYFPRERRAGGSGYQDYRDVSLFLGGRWVSWSGVKAYAAYYDADAKTINRVGYSFLTFLPQ